MNGREIARVVGHHSHSGVARVLDDLVRHGLVRRRTTGTVSLYELNREHLAAGPVEALARLRDQLVAQLSAHVRAMSPAPPIAYLFGSAASGTGGLDSDVDLLLVRPPSLGAASLHTWEDALADLAQQVYRWTGNPANLVEYTTEEVGRPGSTGRRRFLDEVRATGVPLTSRRLPASGRAVAARS